MPTDLAAEIHATCYAQIEENRMLNHANFRIYDPQYPLYADGATKRRWIYLPQGSQIDTSDMDNWVYPVGTVIFKEFYVNLKRVETRILEKIAAGEGSAAWRTSVYVWTTDQTEAHLTTDGQGPIPEVIYEYTVSGHRVPTANQCISCHSGSRDYVLGFTALQLSDLSKVANINSWKAQNFFTNPPANPIVMVGSQATKAAWGYMQSNCATCHNPLGAAAGVGMNLKYNSAALTPEATDIYMTTVNVNNRIVPKDPVNSRIIIRVGGDTMPPRTVVQTTDPMAVPIFTNWINSL